MNHYIYFNVIMFNFRITVLIFGLLHSNLLFASEIKYIITVPFLYKPLVSISDLTTESIEGDKILHAKNFSDKLPFIYEIDKSKRGTLTIDSVNAVNSGINDLPSLYRLIDLFKNDSYVEDSTTQFQNNMTMILLLNRCKSVCSAVNACLENLAIPNHDKNVILIKGFWEPVWNHVNGQKRTQASFEQVKNYFGQLVSKSPESALTFLKKEELKICEGMVPYRELREVILKYAYQKTVPNLLLLNPKTIYFAIHDNDILHLNGVYTHYEQMMTDNVYPDILSTGYQTTPENHKNDIIAQKIFQCTKDISGKGKSKAIEDLCNEDHEVAEALAESLKKCDKHWGAFLEYRKKNEERSFEELSTDIALDMQTRQALGNVDGRLIYWPEPNMLIKIFDENYEPKENIVCKFVDENESEYTDPHESSIVLKSVYEQINEPRCIFNAKFPILLQFNQKFMLNKKLPQSSYSFRDSSIVAIRQLCIESNLVNKFKSTFANLCGFFSKAEFLEVNIEDQDAAGTILKKMSSGMNTKFGITPAINFRTVAKNLSQIKVDFSDDDSEE